MTSNKMATRSSAWQSCTAQYTWSNETFELLTVKKKGDNKVCLLRDLL